MFLQRLSGKKLHVSSVFFCCFFYSACPPFTHADTPARTSGFYRAVGPREFCLYVWHEASAVRRLSAQAAITVVALLSAQFDFFFFFFCRKAHIRAAHAESKWMNTFISVLYVFKRWRWWKISQKKEWSWNVFIQTVRSEICIELNVCKNGLITGNKLK